jgi:hypothetical protein
MKKLIAVVLMVLVLGVGAPVVWADGIQETPGVTGIQETPGVTGIQETPGSIMLDVIVTLATTLVA